MPSSLLGSFDFLHYVVLDGALPEEMRRALDAWLTAQGAWQVTPMVLAFNARVDGESSRSRSRALFTALRACDIPPETGPFRVLLLGPCGTGGLGFKADIRTSAPDDDIGAISF
jgi:hypothetical protein